MFHKGRTIGLMMGCRMITLIYPGCRDVLQENLPRNEQQMDDLPYRKRGVS